MDKYKLDMREGYNDIPLVGFNHIKKFGVLRLEGIGEKHFLNDKDLEMGMAFLQGKARIKDEKSGQYFNVGQRESVFGGLPHGIYLSPGNAIEIEKEGEGALEIAICQSEGIKKDEKIIKIIQEKDVQINQVGKDNWSREVRLIIPPKNEYSKNLILGETINPAGNWSGTPPHKHQEDNLPEESSHEEVYLFKTEKPQGFGIERIYNHEGKEELVLVQNNDVTFMPKDFHQVVAGPGYLVYYFFFLAGGGNELKGRVDPNHSWINK